MRSIDLPDPYELAIQDTEVMKQSILKAEALKNKNNVTQQMFIEIARIKQQMTQYEAEAQAQSSLLKASATANTFYSL
jgi:hypothetical protein